MATYEDWVSVYRTGTDYDADIVRDRLDDSGIPAVVLTQRDHAFNLTVGDLATVHVMVPPDHVDDALALLEQRLTDEELEEAALGAVYEDDDDAHTPEENSKLDSAHEHMNFDAPSDEAPDDDDQPA
ncbi:putative signal transducing protein [Salisaeta longa]|uniref:putative signal transducing protein n=1 Tax=Salisaeta longa TaxID=503170 RepID=UPI0003B6D6A6|nr:DUF2007 domain-containing protein [Salisaeta longa]